MQKENSQEILAQLQRMRELLNSAISLLGGDEIAKESASRKLARPKVLDLDFELPERAFFNRYGQCLSGPERFALVVAYLAKGDMTKEVSSHEVEERWNKMTSFLGTFNRAHPTRAKDRDLVNSPKKGVYHLRPSWREIIK